jgi:uncharacterized protein
VSLTGRAGYPPEIQRALAAHTTLTVAYVDHGHPHACAVFYALTDEGSLIFLTARSTRHGRVLSAQGPPSRVAFTAQAEGQAWSTITGLQGRGACWRPDGGSLDAARTAYDRRFPFVAESPRLVEALSRADYWEIRPDWLRLIDNTVGFGHKTEWDREASAGEPPGSPI